MNKEVVNVRAGGNEYKNIPKQFALFVDNIISNQKDYIDYKALQPWQGGNMDKEKEKEKMDMGEYEKLKKDNEELKKENEALKAKKKKEDEEEEKKKEMDAGGLDLSTVDPKKDFPQPTKLADSINKIVAESVKDRQFTMDSCRLVLDAETFEKVKDLSDTKEIKIEAIKKLNPSIKVDSNLPSSFIDGLFRGVVGQVKSESRLDSALSQLAMGIPVTKPKVKNDSPKKIEGTPLVIADSGDDALCNLGNMWMLDSLEEFDSVCKKTLSQKLY